MMSANGKQERLRRYLQDAIAAEASFETALSSLSGNGEDEEVETLMNRQAAEGQSCLHALELQLARLGKHSSEQQAGIASDRSPKPAFRAGNPEERIAENLVVAFAAVNGSRAVYRALALLASEAGESETERLACEIEARRNRAAGEIWHLIPTRVKIAFNILTAGETDPAVSTRTSRNSLV